MLIIFFLSQTFSSHNSQNHVSSCFLRRKRFKLDRLILATRNFSCDIILMLLWFKSLSREHFEILKSRVEQTSSSILRTCWWFFDSARKSLELWTKIVDKFKKILWFDMLTRWKSLDEIRKCIRVKNRLRCRQFFITRRRRDVMRNWQEQKRYCFWISRNDCEKMRQMYNFVSKQFYDELNNNKRRDLVIASLLLLQNQQTKVRFLHLISFLIQLLITTWNVFRKALDRNIIKCFHHRISRLFHFCVRKLSIDHFKTFQITNFQIFRAIVQDHSILIKTRASNKKTWRLFFDTQEKMIDFEFDERRSRVNCKKTYKIKQCRFVILKYDHLFNLELELTHSSFVSQSKQKR